MMTDEPEEINVEINYLENELKKIENFRTRPKLTEEEQKENIKKLSELLMGTEEQNRRSMDLIWDEQIPDEDGYVHIRLDHWEDRKRWREERQAKNDKIMSEAFKHVDAKQFAHMVAEFAKTTSIPCSG